MLPWLLCPEPYGEVMKDQVKGKIEELHGKATNNKGEELKGKVRRTVGNAKRDIRDLRADAKSTKS